MLGDIPVLNERVRPEPSHQLIFINQVTSVLDQKNQSFEGLRRKGYRGSIENQEALLRIKAEGAKPVQVLCFLFHSPREEILQDFFAISERFLSPN